MTPREFRQEQNLEFDHFQELTSTGINPNYVNIELFANEYHKAKLKLLGIGVVMPRSLTAENGAKALLIGEFFEEIEVPNEEYCGCGECDYCVEVQDEYATETITQKVPVSWTTIKEIYAKIVEHYGA